MGMRWAWSGLMLAQLASSAISLLQGQEIIIEPPTIVPDGVTILGLDTWDLTSDVYVSKSGSTISSYLQISVPLDPGSYDIYLKYQGGPLMAQNARVDIIAGTAITQARVDMRSGGNDWTFLARSEVSSFPLVIRLLTSDTSGTITFDSLRVVNAGDASMSPQPTPSSVSLTVPPLINGKITLTSSTPNFVVDCGQPSQFVEISGDWDDVASSQAIGGSFKQSTATSLHVRFSIPMTAGSYEVFLWYVATPNFSSRARSIVFTGSQGYLTEIDMRSNGGSWVSLGTYQSNGASDIVLLLTTTGLQSGELVCADALRVSRSFVMPSASKTPISAPVPSTTIFPSAATPSPSASPSPTLGLIFVNGVAVIRLMSTPLTTVSGDWEMEHDGGFDGGYYFGSSGMGASSMQLDLPVLRGTYSLELWFPVGTGRSASGKVTVYDGTVNNVFDVDYTKGGSWVVLGDIDFTGPGLAVFWALGANGYVVADTVRLTQILASRSSSPNSVPSIPSGAPAGVVENSLILDTKFNASSVTLYGNWIPIPLDAANWGEYYRGTRANGALSVLFSFAAQSLGVYQVQIWYISHQNRANNVPITISTGSRDFVVVVDMTTGGSDWVSLGVVSLRSLVPVSVTISTAGTFGYVVADAIRIVKVSDTIQLPVGGELIVDSTRDSQWVLSTGAWTQQPSPSAYLGQQLVSSPSQSANLLFILPVGAGSYSVDLWYAVSNSNANSVMVKVSDCQSTRTQFVNMQVGQNSWALLAELELTGECHGLVELIAQEISSGRVVADAVRIVKGTPNHDSSNSSTVILSVCLPILFVISLALVACWRCRRSDRPQVAKPTAKVHARQPVDIDLQSHRSTKPSPSAKPTRTQKTTQADYSPPPRPRHNQEKDDQRNQHQSDQEEGCDSSSHDESDVTKERKHERRTRAESSSSNDSPPPTSSRPNKEHQRTPTERESRVCDDSYDEKSNEVFDYSKIKVPDVWEVNVRRKSKRSSHRQVPAVPTRVARPPTNSPIADIV